MGEWLGQPSPASGNIGSGWGNTGQFGGGFGGYEGAMYNPVNQVAAPVSSGGGGGGFWSGLSNSASGIGNVAKAVAPLAPFGALVASNYIQGRQAEKTAQNAAAQNQQIWQQNAFPRPAAVEAAATENRGQLGQARHAAYQNLASNLAARGWGSGSGLGRAGAAGIERGYLQALGKQATDMTKLAHTPMFGMPSQAYVSPVSGGVENALGGLDTALGYYMMRQMLGG